MQHPEFIFCNLLFIVACSVTNSICDMTMGSGLLMFELHVAASSADAFEDRSPSQGICPFSFLHSVPHHCRYVLFEGIFKQAFCKLKSYINEIRKSILSLQIIILLYFSVSQSQEMKQSRSFPRYYIAFFSICLSTK